MAGLSHEASLNLLRSGDYSDFTIQCKDREFKVHRAIICPDSAYFRTMCHSSFKESKEGRLNLSDDDPEVFNLVLVYLYTRDYDPDAEVPDGFPKTVKIQDSTQATKTGIQANEPQNLAFCRCGRSIEDAEMVKCETCNTWLHTYCYYENGLSPSVHFCEGCATKNHGGPLKSPEQAELISTTRSRNPMVHIAVYAYADKLGIPRLQKLACDKFMAAAKLVPDRELAGLLRAVYENTAPGDSVLRVAVILRLVSLKSNVLKVPDVIEALQQHEPIVWASIEPLIEELQMLERELKDHLQAMERLLQENSTSIASRDREIEALSQDKQQLQNVIRSKDMVLEMRGKALERLNQKNMVLERFVGGPNKFCMKCGKELKSVTVYEEPDCSLRVICNLCHHEHPIV